MTYAPDTILRLQSYWVSQGGVPLGIVGDAPHIAVGQSYHLGRSQLAEDAYSIQLQRDKAGLTEAASAIDLGKLGGSLFQLQVFSQWLVGQCQRHAPGTADIREIIYTPNGLAPIHRWSDPDQKVYTGPGQGDLSHLYHTHISFYRDSEKRSKVGLFVPFFESDIPEMPDTSTEPEPAPPGDPLMAVHYPQYTSGTVTTKPGGCLAVIVTLGQNGPFGGNETYPVVFTADVDGISGGRGFVAIAGGSPDPYASQGHLVAFAQADVTYREPQAPASPDAATNYNAGLDAAGQAVAAVPRR